MDFTWVVNPARRYVPAIHVEPLAHADDLNERFPGAEACPFMGASQHRKHRIFLKTLPFRRRGLRISPAMGCNAVRCEEGHHSAVPRPAGSRASAGQGEQGKGVSVVRHLLEAFLVLLVHRLQTVVGTECSIARYLHMLKVRIVTVVEARH